MRFARNQTPQSSWLRVVAFAMIGAFLLTIAISDAPRLHEQIHKTLGAGHDCAVTILSAGNVEFCDSAVIVGAPDQPVDYCLFRTSTDLRLAAGLDFLLLEHAPPALS